jgi:GNAT superfamily N-acetyltransferase
VPTLHVTTWSLEMRTPPSSAPIAAPRGASIARSLRPPLHFYRYLYETVGRDWLWVDRRRLDDGALSAIVHDPRVEVWVASRDGSPAGYAELDRRVPGQVELAYFGLFPERIGEGLGPFLLDAAVRRAWEPGGIERVWVHTCSLDHPAARRTYERAGFTVFDVREHDEPDPRPLPVRAR